MKSLSGLVVIITFLLVQPVTALETKVECERIAKSIIQASVSNSKIQADNDFINKLHKDIYSNCLMTPEKGQGVFKSPIN